MTPEELKGRINDLTDEVGDLKDQLKRTKAKAGGGIDAQMIELIELKAGTTEFVFVCHFAGGFSPVFFANTHTHTHTHMRSSRVQAVETRHAAVRRSDSPGESGVAEGGRRRQGPALSNVTGPQEQAKA
jgi:hypothetical protein